MMARSHFPFAMCCWWLYARANGLPITGHSSLIAAVGGLLPDIDHPESVIGRRVKILSHPLSAIFGHRGMTHSLLAVIGIGAVLVFMTSHSQYSQFNWMIAPLCIGYLSHILGDALTPSGVPLFYPKKKTYSLNLFKTRSTAEFITVCTLTLLLFSVGGVGYESYSHAMKIIEENIRF